MLKQIANTLSPEAKKLIEELFITLKTADFAVENNANQLLPFIFQQILNQIEILIPKINNPILKSDLKLLSRKLKPNVNEFAQGKGNFLKLALFDEYAKKLLANLV